MIQSLRVGDQEIRPSTQWEVIYLFIIAFSLGNIFKGNFESERRLKD